MYVPLIDYASGTQSRDQTAYAATKRTNIHVLRFAGVEKVHRTLRPVSTWRMFLPCFRKSNPPFLCWYRLVISGTTTCPTTLAFQDSMYKAAFSLCVVAFLQHIRFLHFFRKRIDNNPCLVSASLPVRTLKSHSVMMPIPMRQKSNGRILDLSKTKFVHGLREVVLYSWTD